jgi:hypothetical protein
VVSSKEIYPEYEGGYGPSSYQPMLDSFGDILLQVDDDDYSGDSRVLYKKGDEYGFLIFGWGSCSGCDSLQGVNSHEELQYLIDGLESSIEWFKSLEHLKTRFKTKDWEGTWSYHSDTGKYFVQQVLVYEEENN